jgi:molecular chaperone DnaJ
MDFYLVLGVERGATLADVKRAYKRLARKCHPDVNPGDRRAVAQFRQIAQAYETLSDAERRRRYDATGVPAEADSGSTLGFDGFDFTISVDGNAASTFGDLFADVLHQGEGRRDQGTPERGIDLHQSVTLDFDEVIRGAQRTVTVTRQDYCGTCQGLGQLHVTASSCPHCHGTGAVKSARGHMVFSKPCLHCGGTGQQRQTRCPACGGEQCQMRTESLTIKVPAGLADGARIRIPGKGHVGRNGGETGDLYIDVHVHSHPRFERDGDDLHIRVPIAVHEAALGAKIDVTSLDGPARVRIPPSTQSGQRFRVRERGVPSPRDGHRGDLVVEVQIVLPKLLDERSKELLREFGRINSDDVRQALIHHEGHQGHKGENL